MQSLAAICTNRTYSSSGWRFGSVTVVSYGEDNDR